MKYLLILSLLVSSAFASSGSGNVSNVASLGGIALSNTGTVSSQAGFNAISVPQQNPTVSAYKTLMGTSINSGGYVAFFDSTASTSVQYQVPNAKKFYVGQVCYDIAGGVTQQSFSIGFATATFTNGTATPPTGAVCWGGTCTPSGTIVPFGFAAGQTGGNAFGCFNFPTYFNALTYPFWQNSVVSGAVYIVGYEGT